MQKRALEIFITYIKLTIMIKKLHLKSLLLIAALLVGSSSAWAGIVTRTENFSSSEAASDSYGCSSNATTSGMQDDWDYAWTPANAVYVFQSGIRLGKSSGSPNTGTVTNSTMLSGISTGTSVTIKVYAAQWNTDGGSLVVTYNGSSQTKAPSNSAITGTTTSDNYSSSDFSSSTNFTITKAADVTSFSIASSTKRIFIDKVEVIYDDSPKSANELAWSAATKSVTYSETPYNLPTLTNPHSLAIEYGSTDESVATIDAEGNVTIKNKTGNTTISAHTDGDATYAAGTVSYTLNVTRKVVLVDGVFDFSFGNDYAYGSTMTQGTTIAVNEKTWTSGNITMNVAGRNCWYNDGTFRLYKGSGDDAAGSVTLNCPSSKVITRIEFTGPYTGTGTLSNITANKGTYNVTSTSAIWTGVAQSVTFTTGSASTYINTITVTYSDQFTTEVQSYGWASFIAPAPVQFAANTAYVVTAASVANGLTLAAVTQVPKDTPVLLKGAGDKTVTVIASATAPATNFLSIGDGNDFTSGSYPYVLAKDGTGACFKQWTGSAATLKGRVVLLLDEALSTRSTYELGEEMTGITGVNLNENQNENRYYDLQGRHVAQPTKGLYIINGKKVLVK